MMKIAGCSKVWSGALLIKIEAKAAITTYEAVYRTQLSLISEGIS